MAFTIEEIEQAIQADIQTGAYYYKDYKKSPNYPIITDYLTSKSNTLQGITLDAGNNIWSAIGHLLKDIESPSTNEQLVLDVFHHPDITHYLRYSYLRLLTRYILDYPSEKAFQAAIARFKQLGYTDDHVFTHF